MGKYTGLLFLTVSLLKIIACLCKSNNNVRGVHNIHRLKKSVTVAQRLVGRRCTAVKLSCFMSSGPVSLGARLVS